ncbi:MAG: hypothetical protein ACI89E_000655, partial [Planctomycetota bacterium]
MAARQGPSVDPKGTDLVQCWQHSEIPKQICHQRPLGPVFIYLAPSQAL